MGIHQGQLTVIWLGEEAAEKGVQSQVTSDNSKAELSELPHA